MPPAFARNTFLGFISGAAIALAGFVGSAIVARLLGPEGVGIIAYALWCVTVATSTAGLGIAMVLQRFIPKLRAEGEHDQAKGLIGAASRLSMLATIVGGLLLFCWLYWPARGAIDAPSSASRIALIGLILAWFIFWRMADVYLNYLKGEQWFGEFAKLSSLSALLKLTVMVLGAWVFGVAGAVAGYIAAYLVPASRLYRVLRKRVTISQGLRRQVIGFALTSWSVGVIGGLVWSRPEVVFLEHYAGIGAAGLFAAAATLTDIATQLTQLFISALLPYFSEQHGLGAREEMHRLYQKMTGLVALVMAPLCVAMAAIAPVLVALLFGAEFAAAGGVASVLLLTAAAVNSVGATTANLIFSTGKTRLLLLSNGVGLVGTIVLGFILIPNFGLMGAAWSRAVVQVSIVAIESWYVTRRLGFAPPYRALLAITVAAVIQGAVAYVLTAGLGGITSLILAIPASIVVYAVALRVLAVLPMVEPTIVDTLIANAPRRMRGLVSCTLMLLAPVSKGRSEHD